MPATNLFTNCTITTLAGGAGGIGTTLNPGDLSMVVAAGTGALYSSNFPYQITLGNPGGGAALCEIVTATGKATDTFTIVRGQEGISAKTWPTTTPVMAAVTALAMNAITTQYNVKLYGAKGDGSTDDTTAIAAALAAAGAAGGGVVYLPASQYNVSSALVVPSGVTVKGDGPGGTTIYTTSATADVLQLTGASGHSSVRDLHISAAVSSRTAGAAIIINAAAYDFRVDNVNTDNMYNGVVVGNGTNVPNQIMLSNIRLWNTSNYGIWNQSGANLYMSQCLCSNFGVSNVYGFLWSGQNSVWATQCTMFQCGEGFAIIPTGSNVLQFGWFEDCVSDTITTRCWDFNAGATGTIEQIYMQNCWGSTAGTNEGVQITSAGGTIRDISIVDMQCFNNGGNGILVAGGANVTGIDIRGARCAGNSAASHNTNFGIYVQAGVSSFSITHCRSGSFAGYGSIQSVGIDVQAGASNNYTIAYNDVTGNTNGAIIDGGTGTSKVIVGNIGYNPVGQVTAPAFPATTVAATNGTGSYVTAYVANGTSAITVVQVAGQAGTYVTTGLQIAASGWGVVRIPPNGSVKFTYAAGTPTWTWFGD